MEIFIMDENFENLFLLDMFESFIWTERYNGYGDFEIYTPINENVLEIARVLQEKMETNLDTYVWTKEAQNHMIIESIEITTSVESGNHLIIGGRGLESILDRRVIWPMISLDSKLQYAIGKLLKAEFIEPDAEYRKVPNFLFKENNNSSIESLSIRSQYTGDNVYDTIFAICETYKLGFDITIDQNKNFVFELKMGEDRSYDQDKNPYVVFSPKFENLIDTDYVESSKTLKTTSFVAGESIGITRRVSGVGMDFKGLARREMFVDARDIQSEISDGQYLTNEEYMALLTQRGVEKMTDYQYTKAFTGNIETEKSFVYGRDFLKGDIVQIINEYGMDSKVRVSEVVRSYDQNGYKMYPTFEVVE